MTAEQEPCLTRPNCLNWEQTPARFARWEKRQVLGHGDQAWQRASQAVLHWEIKTRSGFLVQPPGKVAAGERPIILAQVLGRQIREPVEVLQVVEEKQRVGFSYRTLEGHPVSGEEAFIVEREADQVYLRIRSLTGPSSTYHWKMLYPFLRIAQLAVRRKYFRALREQSNQP